MSCLPRLRWVLCCVGLVALLWGQHAIAQEMQAVTVTGESAISYDNAKERATRDAIRQVAGAFLDSQTKVADFTLVQDAIYSRAAGYARVQEVPGSRRRGLDGTYLVTIHAEVSTGKISDDFLAIKNLIEQEGRPEFIVTVDASGPDSDELTTWVTGAVNDYLEKTGLGALHRKTLDESIARQYQRALAAGDTTKATQLRLQMGAPYVVDVAATVTKSSERVSGIPMRFATVQLQSTVAYRDTGAIQASKSATGKGGSPDTDGVQLACQHAVDALFPEVLERILSHWTEGIDVGRDITVQIYGATYSVVSDLANKIGTLEGVTKVTPTEAPENGIARLHVIGRAQARDIADRITAWTGGRLQANLEGLALVTARPASTAPAGTQPAPVSQGGAPLPAPAPPAAASASGQTYVMPAAILGGCLLLGIVLAAAILRKKGS